MSVPLPSNRNIHTLSYDMPGLLKTLVKCTDSVQSGYIVRMLVFTYDMNRMYFVDIFHDLLGNE